MQVHITVPHTTIAAVLAAATVAETAARRMHALTERQVVADLGLVDLDFAELWATSAATFCPKTTQPKSVTTCLTMYSASATQLVRRTENIYTKIRILLS